MAPSMPFLAAQSGGDLFTSQPGFGNGPGSSAIQTLIDYTAAIALGLSLLALLLSAALMGFGHFTNHWGSSDTGKRGLLVSLAAAFLVGIAASLNHFFFHLGQVG
jgi:hypothetical protein